eukprot:CAMPEP_0195074724 /NCGR_PEP_ID=MMETSP0448-20130528/17758_1 /TAXON_ID=66468 /ORGANISM="Heterocapsa triquestra, Strain CCMP 448" /LENGTH=63 /DNA_ID=CAMNT_0040107013 /DNA_START=115 /DNA_END=302 /DNA_ORIENTATION=-
MEKARGSARAPQEKRPGRLKGTPRATGGTQYELLSPVPKRPGTGPCNASPRCAFARQGSAASR